MRWRPDEGERRAVQTREGFLAQVALEQIVERSSLHIRVIKQRMFKDVIMGLLMAQTGSFLCTETH